MTTDDLSTTASKLAHYGFYGLHCPQCGTTEDAQLLNLIDLQTFHCCGCDEQYTTDDIREMVAAWQKVLNWIDAAPLPKLEG